MKEILRREFKYELSAYKEITVKNYIKAILNSDSHNGNIGYKVRSLYFDTEYDRDYYDKEDGLENRRKIRIRVYDTNSNTAYIEMKQKSGNYQKKRSLQITKSDVYSMIKCKFDVLNKYDSDFAKELFALMSANMYQPKVVVDYQREAYIGYENNTRITFDKNICSNECDFDIFDNNLCMNPVWSTDKTILEVKYNGFLLSYIKDAIRTSDSSPITVSKYCYARTTII